MIQPTHTPAPWIFKATRYPNGELLYTVYNSEGDIMGDKLSEANARLIAAAPKLLDACKLMFDAFINRHSDNGAACGFALHEMEKAIAKAEGK